MARPTKKEIKAAVEKLKEKNSGVTEIPKPSVSAQEIKFNSARSRPAGV